MSRPNFVTKAMIDAYVRSEVELELAAKRKHFQSQFNQWWQDSAVVQLTRLGSFSASGQSAVEVSQSRATIFGLGEWAIATNQRVLETSAPYTVDAVTEHPERYFIVFTCVK